MLVMLAVLLSCQSDKPVDSADASPDTEVPTDTQEPTDTDAPTDTEEPTDTEAPTDTETPTDTDEPTLGDPPLIQGFAPTVPWWPDASPVLLRAQVADASDLPAALEVTWHSDRDGPLGTSTPDADGRASLSSLLSAGEHELTATVSNTSGLTAETGGSLTVLDCGDTSDGDGDGFTPADGDCDDADPTTYPGADGPMEEDRACAGSHPTVLPMSAYERMTADLSSGGDLNGDGFEDLVFSRYFYGESGPDRAGTAHLLMGGPLSPAPNLDDLPRLVHAKEYGEFARSSLILPDLTGDGIDELALLEDHGKGNLFLFHGREAWSDQTSNDADYTINATSLTSLGSSSMASHDFNGDGYSDLVVTSPGSTEGPYMSFNGRVHLFEGSPTLSGSVLVSSADLIIRGATANASLGTNVAIDDFNDNGTKELLLGASTRSGVASENEGVIYSFEAIGGRSGIIDTSDAEAWASGDEDYNSFGTYLGTPGDVTGDGVPDLMISTYAFDQETWSVLHADLLLLPGGADYLAELDLESDLGSWRVAGDSYSSGNLGGMDLSGDGHAELLFGYATTEQAGKLGVLDGTGAAGGVSADFDAEARLLTSSESVQLITLTAGDDYTGDERPDFAAYTADEALGTLYLYESHPTCVNP